MKISTPFLLLDNFIFVRIIDPIVRFVYRKFERDNFWLFDVFYAIAYVSFFVYIVLQKRGFDFIATFISTFTLAAVGRFIFESSIGRLKKTVLKGYSNPFRKDLLLAMCRSVALIIFSVETGATLMFDKKIGLILDLSILFHITWAYCLCANYPHGSEDRSTIFDKNSYKSSI